MTLLLASLLASPTAAVFGCAASAGEFAEADSGTAAPAHNQASTADATVTNGDAGLLPSSGDSAVDAGATVTPEAGPGDADSGLPAFGAAVVVNDAGYASCLSLPSAPIEVPGCGCAGLAPSEDDAGVVPCTGDVTTALQNALRPNATVRLGAGQCTLSSTVTLPSGSSLLGAGISATRLSPAATFANTADSPILAIGSLTPTNATPTTRVIVRDLTVDGTAATANQPDIGNPLTANVYVGPLSSNVCIDTIESLHSYTAGVYIQGQCVEVRGSHVHDNLGNGTYATGYKMDGERIYAENISIFNNHVDNNSLAHNTPPQPNEPDGHTWDGIDFDEVTRNGVVWNNELTGDDIIFSTTLTDIPSSGHVAWGNVTTSNLGTVNGIEVSGYQTDFEVIGNTISNVNHSGITMGDELVGGLIAGNTIRGTSGPGINIAISGNDTARPMSITLCDNVISGAGDLDAGDAGYAITANKSGVAYLQSCANAVQGAVDYSGAQQKTLIVADACAY